MELGFLRCDLAVSEFNKIKKYEMVNPLYSIDIDNQLDWLVAETIINNKLL